jgi:hypothetical protein
MHKTHNSYKLAVLLKVLLQQVEACVQQNADQHRKQHTHNQASELAPKNTSPICSCTGELTLNLRKLADWTSLFYDQLSWIIGFRLLDGLGKTHKDVLSVNFTVDDVGMKEHTACRLL